MGTLSKLGRQLTEAVHRQGQILPTENESWGFFGTVATSAEIPTADMPVIWTGAFKAFLEVFQGIDPKSVREFLDSKGGRYLADAIVDELKGADGAKTNRVVKRALKGRDGKWVSKELARIGGTEVGIPPGGTAEIATKVKQVARAFDDVQGEERKKNWKQRYSAMRVLEKAADGLLSGVRAWFTSSGSTPSFEVQRGGGQKVRVTIPEADEPAAETLEEGKWVAPSFKLQMDMILTNWAKIEHLQARVQGRGTPFDAKDDKERAAMNKERDEAVDAIERGLKNATKLFAAWKAEG